MILEPSLYLQLNGNCKKRKKEKVIVKRLERIAQSYTNPVYSVSLSITVFKQLIVKSAGA